MDRRPGRRTLSPSGRWEALVAEGGALSVRKAGSDAVPVAEGVDARLAFSRDEGWLAYAREGLAGETDLHLLPLGQDGPGVPTQLTGGPGSEDRPVFSPEGDRLAFVSGRSGLASWWVLDLADPASARQLSNTALGKGDGTIAGHRPGQPPPGWVPVPDGVTYGWTAAGLEWVTAGRAYTLVVPE